MLTKKSGHCDVLIFSGCEIIQRRFLPVIFRWIEAEGHVRTLNHWLKFEGKHVGNGGANTLAVSKHQFERRVCLKMGYPYNRVISSATTKPWAEISQQKTWTKPVADHLWPAWQIYSQYYICAMVKMYIKIWDQWFVINMYAIFMIPLNGYMDISMKMDENGNPPSAGMQSIFFHHASK